MPYLLIALQLLPVVLKAVMAVEEILCNATGKDKKSAVMSTVTAASATLSATTKGGGKMDSKWTEVLSNLIDSVVATLNTSGLLPRGGGGGTTISDPPPAK